MPRSFRSRSTPLTALELAEGVVLGDVAALLVVVGWFLPATTLFIGASVIPFAALVVRHRPRALLVGAASACAVGFLILGVGLATNVALAAGFGLVVGSALKRGWGPIRAALGGLAVVWTPLAGLSVAFLLALPGTRRLTLQQVQILWRAMRRALVGIGLTTAAREGDAAVSWLVRRWWVAIPAAEALLVAAAIPLAMAVARPVIGRLNAALRTESTIGTTFDGRTEREPAPVPASLDNVSFRYPGSTADALADVSLEVPAGALIVVLGPNGSGKTTLARILTGTSPTNGTVDRPGGAGLGEPGGSALVFQRPESQVLGVRVADDLVWGLPPDEATDPAALLSLVALAGFEERETSTLSGGELQRLAIAAALARRPALLISDESTAMLDPPGRGMVMELLRELPARDGTTVVHITHRLEEARDADLVVVMSDGRILTRWRPREVSSEGMGSP